MVRLLKILAWLVGTYVAIVAAFETLIGVMQPANANTLTLITEPDTAPVARVLARLDDGGQLYVAANHWPRAWYRAVRGSPEVALELDGEAERRYTAVPVEGAEHERLMATFPHSIGFRILTGFPPRRFLRLEPTP
ncbi:MAG: hypothetical protein AAF648_14435 [Pseudomonadota bacterium]